MDMQKGQKESFPDWLDDDTISVSINLEDEDMIREAMFHTNYAIYLYCAVEDNIADRIMHNDFSAFPLPLKLYETKEIAKASAKNIKNAKVIKVAVWLHTNYEYIYYDELTMTDSTKADIKKRVHCKTDEELYRKCLYTRKLLSAGSSKNKFIEYTVNDIRIISNPQYVNII